MQNHTFIVHYTFIIRCFSHIIWSIMLMVQGREIIGTRTLRLIGKSCQVMLRCFKLIIQCRNSINTVFLLLCIYIYQTILYCYEYVEIVSNLRLEDATLSTNNVIQWRSLSRIPRGIFRSTYIFNGYSSVLTLPRYFGVLENLQFNDNPQHLDILYVL